MSGGGPVGSLRGREAVSEGSEGQVCGLRPRRGGCQGCGGRMAGVPRPKLHSASEYSMSGRIRTRSVQPSALRSAQGRASTCGALSLSTPDSILMCYPKDKPVLTEMRLSLVVA